MMTRGAGPAGPQPQGAIAPASWWEWLYSVYPPDEFAFPCRGYGVTIAPALSAQLAGQIEITSYGFVYDVRMDYWNTTGGGIPTFPCRLQIMESSELNWTGGLFSARAIANAPAPIQGHVFPFPVPREVIAGTQLSITVDNTLNSAAGGVTADVTLWMIQVLKRSKPIERE